MAGERNNDFDRWWHSRQTSHTAGGSGPSSQAPLRGSSPGRGTYPSRHDSPGVRHAPPRDRSPFRTNTISGHGPPPSTVPNSHHPSGPPGGHQLSPPSGIPGSPATNTSHRHREGFMGNYMGRGGGGGGHQTTNNNFLRHNSPRQPPSPVRGRDPSPIRHSNSYHGVDNMLGGMNSPRGVTGGGGGGGRPQHTSFRGAPSMPEHNMPQGSHFHNTSHHQVSQQPHQQYGGAPAPQQQQQPQPQHGIPANNGRHTQRHKSPRRSPSWISNNPGASGTVAAPTGGGGGHPPLGSPRGPNSPRHHTPHSHPHSPPSHNHSHNHTHGAESPITQVPQGGSAGPVFWPQELLPPEPEPSTFTPLLPAKDRVFRSRNTLVLDLDETLVHSSFKPLTLVDMLLDIELEDGTQTVYVRKRPYVEDFLARMSEIYEVVVLTASLEVYADRVLDQLDPEGYWIHHRLFRDSCANLNGNYIKDLSYLGRPLHEVIIIDNSPTSYLFQPRNAVPISSWFDDPTDTELRELLPVLERAAKVDNVYPVLDSYRQAIANGERWYA